MQTKSLKAQIDFLFSTTKNAQNAFQALQPDLNQRHEKRSQTILKAHKKVLSANISALDEKALKSSMQSMFKAIALIQKLQQIKKES